MGVRRCYLTQHKIQLSIHIAKVHRAILVRAWIKPVDDEKVILWNIHGFYTIKLRCLDSSLLKSIKCGSLVELRGKLVNLDEICVEALRVVHAPIGEEPLCKEDIPRDPEVYAKSYYKYVKHPTVLRAVLVYSLTLTHLRSFLLKNDFVELPSPILGYASDPGLRGARKVSVELYGKLFELQSSVIMYKQLYASALDRIFYTARNIRVEPVENIRTGRHLVEFTQVDVEAADISHREAMRLAEAAVYRSIKKLLNTSSELFEDSEIERLEREITKPPYPRLTYEEALTELEKMGFAVKYGEELPFVGEVAIATKYGTPVWIEGFPATARGFYYLEDPRKPGHNVDYNLVLPGGHGEVLDGGCREYRYEFLVRKIREIHGEPVEKYSWFLELSREGLIRPTCGWGLGVERLVKYILNLEHIAYATPHPRLPGILGP